MRCSVGTSSPPSVASGEVPKVARVAPSSFNFARASVTSKVAVPAGASGSRRTSSRYQALRAGIGLAARKPTSLPFTRAAKYFLYSECRKGSSATSHPNVVAARRASSQCMQSRAVSLFNDSSMPSGTISTSTPARRAWFTPARSFLALSPRGFQVLRSKYGEAPTFTAVKLCGAIVRAHSALVGTKATTRPCRFANDANWRASSAMSSSGASGSPAASQTRPNSP